MVFFDRLTSANRIFSVICIAIILLWLSMPASAQVIDEGDMSKSEANAGITNRPMGSSVNLKKVQAAFDKAKPQENTKTYTWKANSTFQIRLREFMQTIVVLPAGEKISGLVLGDGTNFAVKPIPGSTNRFVVWARDPGADTNLAIFGESGRIYSFYLRIDDVHSTFLPDLIVYIMDDSQPYDMAQAGQTELGLSRNHANTNAGASGQEKKTDEKECLDCKAEEYPAQQFARDYLRELPQTSGKQANTEYVMSKGSRELAPLAIFDDGYFTYFKFGDGNLDSIKVPVIYQVVDGYDSLLNTRVEGGYIVAETTNEKFTIRRGEKFLCIKNKKYTKNYAKTTSLKD